MKTNKSRFIANPTKFALNKVLNAGLNELSKIGLIASSSSDGIKGEWTVTLPSLIGCEETSGDIHYEWAAVEYACSSWDDYQMLLRMVDKLCDDFDKMN